MRIPNLSLVIIDGAWEEKKDERTTQMVRTFKGTAMIKKGRKTKTGQEIIVDDIQNYSCAPAVGELKPGAFECEVELDSWSSASGSSGLTMRIVKAVPSKKS